jgi:ferrochelatase
MDPLVVDLPFILRWFLVRALIVPRRKYLASEAYKKIWSPEGSPLLVHSRELVEKMRGELSASCELAMRYGRPGLAGALESLRGQGVTDLAVIPLYPQYALSSTESSRREVERVVARMGWSVKLNFLTDFFGRHEFLGPLALKIRESVDLASVDRLVFSFHGLPVRHVQRASGSADCYQAADCCARVSEGNRLCYRAQCFATARGLAARLGLEPAPSSSAERISPSGSAKYLVTFQSRLGRREWIKPYTDIELPRLARAGARRIAVVCPSFVCDCLETLEEINIRARRDFLSAGGESLTYIPCLNADDEWVQGLAELVREIAPTV